MLAFHICRKENNWDWFSVCINHSRAKGSPFPWFSPRPDKSNRKKRVSKLRGGQNLGTVLIPNFTKEFSCKIKVSTWHKNFFFLTKNFFSKIVSNHHICLQTWFLRYLKRLWKLWKQHAYVKKWILLKILFFLSEIWWKVMFFKNYLLAMFLLRHVAFKAFKLQSHSKHLKNQVWRHNWWLEMLLEKKF